MDAENSHSVPVHPQSISGSHSMVGFEKYSPVVELIAHNRAGSSHPCTLSTGLSRSLSRSLSISFNIN